MPKMLRAAEVAALLGIHIMSVYRLSQTGELQAIKIRSRGIRFYESEVERYLKVKNMGSEDALEALKRAFPNTEEMVRKLSLSPDIQEALERLNSVCPSPEDLLCKTAQKLSADKQILTFNKK